MKKLCLMFWLVLALFLLLSAYGLIVFTPVGLLAAFAYGLIGINALFYYGLMDGLAAAIAVLGSWLAWKMYEKILAQESDALSGGSKL